MALKAYYTDAELDEIKDHLGSEPVKALGLEFKKDDAGHNILAVSPRDGFALENVTGLRNSVERTREERDAALAKAKAIGDLDPSKLPDILDKARRFDSLDPEAAAGKAKAQLEEWKKEYTTKVGEEHTQALAAVARQRDALQGQLAKELIESRAMQVLARVKGSPDLILPVIRNMTDAVLDEDGNMKVRVLNPLKPGQERIGKDGEPMGLEELILDEIKQDPRYAPAFGGSDKSGGGEGAGSGGGGNFRRSTMTALQKSQYIREHGRDQYHKLPD